MISSGAVVEREKRALAAHRAALHGSSLPPPNDAPNGTFLHGFFLPFSLIVATMRDRELRGPYLRVALVRGLVVALIGAIAIARGGISAEKSRGPRSTIVIHKSKAEKSKRAKHAPVHVDVPGLHVDLDEEHDNAKVSVLGQDVPVTKVDDDPVAVPGVAPPLPPAAPAAPAPAGASEAANAVVANATPAEQPTRARRAWNVVRNSWAWLLALLAFLSAAEGVVVFLSRRWDDWLSFHASRLAAIRPEDEAPKDPRLAIDLAWLYRKMKRRIRGYIVFAAGIPALLPLLLVPWAGEALFTIALTFWGWYWLGVFTAAKSAHAWADEERALAPAPIRALAERVSPSAVFGPLRFYARAWAKITRSVNPAATTFERSPAAVLGLALARVILSLPGIYLLARPIVPVAAGRLCAEADPAGRFSVPSAPAAIAASAAASTAAAA